MTSKSQQASTYDEQSFSTDVIDKWGDICESLVENKNQLHMQMFDLGRLVSEAAQSSDVELRGQILRFLEHTLSRKDVALEIENAVAISFLSYQDIEKLGILQEIPAKMWAIVENQRLRDESST